MSPVNREPRRQALHVVERGGTGAIMRSSTTSGPNRASSASGTARTSRYDSRSAAHQPQPSHTTTSLQEAHEKFCQLGPSSVTFPDDWFELTFSDGDPALVPHHYPQGQLPTERPLNANELLKSDHEINLDWRQKLGDFLAYDHLKIASRQPGARCEFKLGHFPAHYQLIQHVKSIATDEHILRRDTYLVGSKNVIRFRSPNEFKPHLAWLASGGQGICRCKYCGTKSKTKE